jgi:hypothetical protein
MPAFAARARERKIKINLRIQFRSADFWKSLNCKLDA